MIDPAPSSAKLHLALPGAAMTARRLLAGVRRDATTCWVDLLASVTIGYVGLAVGADPTQPTAWRLAALVAAVLGLHRATAFVHEIAHVGRREMPGFKLAWNVLIGVPLCIPSFLAEGVHAQHHRLALYGSAADPEYLPRGLGGRAARLRLAASGVLLPFLFVARFLVAPLTLASPALRRVLDARCSALAFNPLYRRPPLPPRLRREAAVAEVVTSAWVLAVAVAVGAGAVPLGAVVHAMAVMAVVGLLNQVRAAYFAHHFELGDRPATVEMVLADTHTLGGPAVLMELLAPLGARYHALHHLAPWVPYHALGRAHRMLQRTLDCAHAAPRAQVDAPATPGLGVVNASTAERLAWVAAVAGWHAVYHLIPGVVDASAAARLTTPLDRAVPTVAGWMFAYAAIYPIVLVPPLVVRDLSLVRRLGAAHLWTQTIAFAAFLVLPVTSSGLRPETVATETFAGWALALNYRIDAPLNCFPSLHVATTTLTALALARVSRVLGSFAAVVALAIALSTLLVKQHYVADVVAGVALGGVAARVWLGRRSHREGPVAEGRAFRTGVAGFATLYAALLLGGAAAYASTAP